MNNPLQHPLVSAPFSRLPRASARNRAHTNHLPAVADEVLASLDPRVAQHPDFHDGWGEIRPRSEPHPTAPSLAQHGRIVMTDLDVERLQLVLRRHRHTPHKRRLSGLRAELERARVVSARAVPAEVVTMNSRVLCRGRRERDVCELTLVYPHHADLGPHARDHAANLSVLSPFGTALLGLAPGALVDPGLQRGRPRWWVSEVLYQPEREGHYHM
jgi:regulator of nucleoside diphosphate kinase